MEPGAAGGFAQSNTPVIDLQQSTSQFKLDGNDEWQQQKQQIMHGRHQQQWDNHSSQQEQFEQNQPKHPEQRQQHVDEQMVDIGTSAESNSFFLHLQQFTSQPQGENQSDWPKDNKHEQHQEQKDQQLKGELQRQQNQQEDHSNQQELFQQSQTQYPEQGQPHFDEQSDHQWPETLQVQQQQQKEEQEQHQHEEKQQYMQQSLQTHQQQQKEEQEQHQHEEKQQYVQQSLQTHQQQQKEEQEQHQQEEKQQYVQQSLQTHQQQQKEEQEQHQHEEKQQYVQQSLQTHQQQHKEEQEQHQHEEKQQYVQQSLQTNQQQQKEEQEQHQHEEKQQYMQQSLQTHQQSQQQQLQPQVQQQQVNHQQLVQAAASGQNTSRSISFSYLVEMILPHLPREQAEWVSARLLKFKRNEITKDDFVSGTRKVVGDQILVQTVKQIQKKAMLATSTTATLHHTLSAFGGPISGGHSSGNLLQGQMCIQPLSLAVVSQINASAKVPLFGQNNCYEATCPLNQLPRKKQKVSGDYLDQRIDPLIDVTAFSGINLREEEENLFAGSKDESCVAEAMRNAVQEEEERFFLEKGPLRAKIAGIMEKYGIKYISTDSEHCLSLCIEEHLRAVIGQLIRLSKQRVDLERVSHKVVLTSDVQHQILVLNKKVKVDLEKKQAEEEEKLQKLYRTSMTENNASTDVEKDESQPKIQRGYKEYNEMRSNATNAAVRAAIGGDDMLLKWQWMAEQARQKHKGTMYQASNACTNIDVSRKNMAGRLEAGNVLDRLDAPSTGMIQNLGRGYPSSWCTRTEPIHTICVKDVIALLERMSHMTKSTLLYRLYERDAECNKEKPFGN